MARSGVETLKDDEEADIASYMLNACGLELHDFYLNERIFTRENFEKNYDVLVKMVETRDSRRAPYLVLGYFALLTGGKISERIRQNILEAAKWKHEKSYWKDKEFALIRRIYLEDFREKLLIFQSGVRLHTAIFKYTIKDFVNSSVVIGLKQLKDVVQQGTNLKIRHANLDGWNLNVIPQEIFKLKNLITLSLEHNHLNEIQSFSSLKRLKYLYLSYNKIKKLPDMIEKLKWLEELDLIHNNINELPKSIANLKNLKYIYIRGTKIKYAPKFLKNARLDELNHTLYL